MGLPLNKRDYDVFVSYAHSDRAFVENLYNWLRHWAGLEVWWDDRNLSGGALLATDLQKAIERCRAVLLVASDESLSRGWVQAEYNAAMDERANYRGFRVVALRMPNAKPEQLMRGISWVDVPSENLDANTAAAILRALYPSEHRGNPATARDVYVSASWHGDDSASANLVCRALCEQGFRLVGDSKDQAGFGSGDRVERIMSSCGAFVAIVPYRGQELAVPGEKPYKYFLQEIDFAAEQGIPSLIVADPRVRRPDEKDKHWLRMETMAATLPDDVKRFIGSFWEEWQRPPKPHYVFCAMDLDSDDTKPSGPVRQLVELITSMPTKVGNEIHEGNPENVNAAVRRAVCDAFLVIADLTDDNVNACIEAGMGLAVGTNVELLATAPQRRPPFMLRERNMPTYKDKVEQIGLIHRLARKYRRRVINAELL